MQDRYRQHRRNSLATHGRTIHWVKMQKPYAEHMISALPPNTGHPLAVLAPDHQGSRHQGGVTAACSRRASPRPRPAGSCRRLFRAIMTTAALVLPDTTVGMIEASTTRRLLDAAHAQPLVDHGGRHPRPCGRCWSDETRSCPAARANASRSASLVHLRARARAPRRCSGASPAAP